MALAEKWLTSAETTTAVAPAVGKAFIYIQVVNEAKFHTLTVETGHTDGGTAVANATAGSAVAIPPGLYEGRWVAVKLHSGMIRVYVGY